MEGNDQAIAGFLFAIFFLFHLCHFHHEFEAKDTGNQRTNEMSLTSFHHAHESSSNDRLARIEAQNRRHEKNIFLLKTAAIEDRKMIKQLTGRVASLEASAIDNTVETKDEVLRRRVRPVRLLPDYMFRGKDVNQTENEKRFYGPPTGCDDLTKLGYTLNGFYMVNAKNQTSNKFKLEAVICRFKAPRGSQEEKEERLGFVNMMTSIGSSSHALGIVANQTDTSPALPTTEGSDDDSSEITYTTTKLTGKQVNVRRSEEINAHTTKSHGGDIESQVPIRHTSAVKIKSKPGKGKVHCSKLKEEHYLFKNFGEPITCLGIEFQEDEGHRLVWFDCDSQRSEIQWMKRESHSDLIKSAFHICHVLDRTACLTISSHLNAGKWIVNLDQFTDDNSVESTNQQWKIKPKTEQLVNPDSKLCLTSYDSKPLSSTSIFGPLVKVDACKVRPNIPMQQIWSLDLISRG